MTQRIVPDPLAGAYAPITWGGAVIGASLAAATYIIWAGPSALGTSNAGTLTSGNSVGAAFYLDPAQWTVSGLTTKLRLHAYCHVGATAPAVTLTVGLYPVGSFTNTAIQTAGTVVSGSTVAFASPAINSHAQNVSTDVNVPAAGFFFIGVAISGTTAASSATQFGVSLQRRWV